METDKRPSLFVDSVVCGAGPVIVSHQADRTLSELLEAPVFKRYRQQGRWRAPQLVGESATGVEQGKPRPSAVRRLARLEWDAAVPLSAAGVFFI